MGTPPDDKSELIHDLKLRITSISGYAQLLERELLESEHTTDQQQEYIAKLRRLINDFAVMANELDANHRSQKKHRTGSDDRNVSSSPCNSHCSQY